MSRTHRNLTGMNRCIFRRPKTYNEIRTIKGLIHDVRYDDEFKECNISGMNRLHSRKAWVPTAWDDNLISGYFQEDYKRVQ